MSVLIYHLAERSDWAAAADEYRAQSLDYEGFLHCSTADQLAAVAARHFPNRNDLILLTIDPEPLGDSVVFEDKHGLGEDFPHIYGPLPASSVTATAPYLAHLEEGLFTSTRFDREWMDRVLHPEFSEVGRSGRTYTKSDILAATAEDLEVELPLRGYRLDLIDEDVAIARYVSRERHEGIELPAERTSVWVNTNEGWRLRLHQGTPLPEE